MDNFFEVLIYLLIIVSFLSSFFRKKKKRQQSNTEIPETPERVSVEELKSIPQPKPVEENFDVLNEIERFFKVGTEEAGKIDTSSVTVNSDLNLKTDESHFKEDKWHKQTESEHKYETDWKKKSLLLNTPVKKIDKQINDKAKKFEQMLIAKKSSADSTASLIRDRLRNKNEIRELIIISEILGRPKALRR